MILYANATGTASGRAVRVGVRLPLDFGIHFTIPKMLLTYLICGLEILDAGSKPAKQTTTPLYMKKLISSIVAVLAIGTSLFAETPFYTLDRPGCESGRGFYFGVQGGANLYQSTANDTIDGIRAFLI